MKKIYSKKHSHIKKQFIAQKFLDLLGKNKYVLFLHHSGRESSIFQKFKEQVQLDFPLDSLLLPSKISRYISPLDIKCISGQDSAFSRGEKEISIQGGALLVACSSLSQVGVVLEKCPPPNFLCIGGCFPGMPFSTYLDIQRWVELHRNSEQVYGSLLAQLVQWQKVFLPLENHFQRLAFVPWANWLLRKKLLSLLEAQGSRLSEQVGKRPPVPLKGA